MSTGWLLTGVPGAETERDTGIFNIHLRLFEIMEVTNGAFPLQRGACFKRAVPGPFLVAFPLGVVPASGYYFTVFLAP